MRTDDGIQDRRHQNLTQDTKDRMKYAFFVNIDSKAYANQFRLKRSVQVTWECALFLVFLKFGVYLSKSVAMERAFCRNYPSKV